MVCANRNLAQDLLSESNTKNRPGPGFPRKDQSLRFVFFDLSGPSKMVARRTPKPRCPSSIARFQKGSKRRGDRGLFGSTRPHPCIGGFCIGLGLKPLGLWVLQKANAELEPRLSPKAPEPEGSRRKLSLAHCFQLPTWWFGARWFGREEFPIYPQESRGSNRECTSHESNQCVDPSQPASSFPTS